MRTPPSESSEGGVLSLSSSVLFLSLLLPEGKTLLPLRFPALVRALAPLLFGSFPLQTQGLLGPVLVGRPAS